MNIEILNNYINIKTLTIILFILCYFFIIIEEYTKIKKSKITIIIATIVWIIISINANEINEKQIIKKNIEKTLLDYCELFLFLLVAMTYINSLKKLKLLKYINNLITSKNLSYKKIFWLTGFLSFIISPIADNLTTAIIMSSIIINIEKKDKKFINLSCINIVIASNAGGAFSPFGDITTLMIWQNEILEFKSFLYIFIPSLFSFLIPSLIMSLSISNKKAGKKYDEFLKIENNSIIVAILFLLTIFSTVIVQSFLKLPSSTGMMFGLGMLLMFDSFKNLKLKEEMNNIEWETLLFFYGIMFFISALNTLGILNDISKIIYDTWVFNEKYKYIIPNIMIGFLSAIIDNIPITFAIINMNLEMTKGDWLLVTLSTGTGGSILSIGSAAGVAIMGLAKGKYTFFSHLKWSIIITFGFLISVIIHIIINKNLFL